MVCLVSLVCAYICLPGVVFLCIIVFWWFDVVLGVVFSCFGCLVLGYRCISLVVFGLLFGFFCVFCWV